MKIKEKRIQFAKHHPIANGILSVISCIAIGLLAIPWTLGLFSTAFSGSGPDSPMEGYFRGTERKFNWIRPVFSTNNFRKAIDGDKNALAQSLTKINEFVNQEFVDTLAAQHRKNIDNHGEIGWGNSRECLQHFNDISKIIRIADETFGKELVWN